jgi:hypothetical protein
MKLEKIIVKVIQRENAHAKVWKRNLGRRTMKGCLPTRY